MRIPVCLMFEGNEPCAAKTWLMLDVHRGVSLSSFWCSCGQPALFMVNGVMPRWGCSHLVSHGSRNIDEVEGFLFGLLGSIRDGLYHLDPRKLGRAKLRV